MTSVSSVCRLVARFSGRQSVVRRRDANFRGFHASPLKSVAQNLSMPALSPTMIEGNIARWNVKEGDSFAAGDVLLEIETDKASMDVEAQDDGVVAKIIQGDGSKGIKVGARIAVLAETGDDLSFLEILPEEKKVDSPEQQEKPNTAKEMSSTTANTARPGSSISIPSGPLKKQTYPLLPSVEHLMHLHGLDSSVVDKMTPSGPNNRLLKGDVLSYLGLVQSSYPSELSGKIQKLSHLDLSNIKAVPAPKPTARKASAAAASKETQKPEIKVNVTLPVSMKSVHDTQERIMKALGIEIPDQTFIDSATNMANENLPRAKDYKPSADELFNSILGLKTCSNSAGSRGVYRPTASSEASPSTVPWKHETADIIDFLSGKKASPQKSPLTLGKLLSRSEDESRTFQLVVPKAEEERAQVFLHRMKTVLETEPTRLVQRLQT